MKIKSSQGGSNVSLKQFAYEYLKDKILSLELESNSPIFEVDVASELGISRTPVREALSALEKEGLVQIIRGKGAFVAPTSISKIIESYEVREVLEGLAARLAIGRISNKELDELEAVFAASIDGEADEKEVSKAAERLHQLLAEYSGNEYLQQMLSMMREQIRRVRHVTIHRSYRLEDSSKEHIELIHAIRDQNADLSEQLMRKHIQKVRLNLERSMMQRKY